MVHLNRGATSLGIFPEDEVKEGLRSRRFLPTDLGWREGMANWQPLSQFPEFASEMGATAAAEAPPQQTPQLSVPEPVGVAAGVVVRSGLPWDQRATKGMFSAFIETLQLVLTKPTEAFSMMRREGGLGDPLIYALIGGTFGLAVYFVYRLVFQSLGLLAFGGVASKNDPFLYIAGMGAAGFLLIIFVPVLVVLNAFVNAAILHLCLMLVRGAKQSFETTFRVVCFSSGSVSPLFIIPVCGALVVAIWDIVLRCIGLARAHETDTGRAVLAVFLPLILCCGCAILIGISIPALMHLQNR